MFWLRSPPPPPPPPPRDDYIMAMFLVLGFLALALLVRNLLVEMLRSLLAKLYHVQGLLPGPLAKAWRLAITMITVIPWGMMFAMVCVASCATLVASYTLKKITLGWGKLVSG